MRGTVIILLRRSCMTQLFVWRGSRGFCRSLCGFAGHERRGAMWAGLPHVARGPCGALQVWPSYCVTASHHRRGHAGPAQFPRVREVTRLSRPCDPIVWRGSMRVLEEARGGKSRGRANLRRV